MNKRGQFYIIMIVILCMAIFTITTKNNQVEEPILIGDFNELSQNYVVEASNIVNYAIYNNENVSKILPNFTESFLVYAKEKNPSIHLFYIYNNGSSVNFRNYLDETTFYENNTIFGSEQDSVNQVVLSVAGKEFVHQVPVKVKNFGDEFVSSEFPSAELVTLRVGGIFHNFKLDSTGPQLRVYLESQQGNIMQVYHVSGTEQFPKEVFP